MALAGALAAGRTALAATIERGICSTANQYPKFDTLCFTDDSGGRHQLYVTGKGGPPVLLLHELPGLVDADLLTAEKIADHGYTVIAPLFFGQPGGKGDFARYYRQVCGADQFACNKSTATSPHTRWLRELCRVVRVQWPEGKGIGVIGMCLTGALPLGLLREPSVVAPVVCQPTIPFNFWTIFGLFTDKRGLGLDPKDLEYAKSERDVPILGVRYRSDWRCRKERFERLAEEFKGRFFRLDQAGHHHSTLGGDFCDVVFLEVLAFLNQQLRQTPDPQADRFPRKSQPGSRKEVNGSECAAVRP
jgi:dienelactone hydrolase